MRAFLIRRLAQGAAVIFLAASITFLLVHLAPGDPFTSSSRDPLNAAAVAARRAAYGLDRPFPEHYVRFMVAMMTGDFGPSLRYGRPVADVLRDALPNTLLLMGTALIFSFVVGGATGTWQAARAGTAADRATGTTSLIVASMPEFWLGIVLLVLFTSTFALFPTGGTIDLIMHDTYSLPGRVLDRLRHLVLPALTLTLLNGASIARYQRSAVLDVLPRDFVRTARAKGATERQVIWRHALRNALVPTIVLVGLSLPTLLGGAVFVEQIFKWRGMGWVATEAFAARDYGLVVGASVIGAVLVVVGGILTDVLHAVADPRLRAR